jgi:hypothetical protein
MKSLIKTLLTFSASMMLQNSGIAASQDFTFENDSGYTVYHLYVSPHSLSRWGNDVLGRGVLGSGQSTYIYWNEEQDFDLYDVRVDYANGTHYDFTEGYDLTQIDEIWITANGGRLVLRWHNI